MEIPSAAKFFIFSGAFLIFTGLMLIIFNKAGINIGIGKLPGDILVQRGSFTFYFPLATCILISIVATIVLSLILKR